MQKYRFISALVVMFFIITGCSMVDKLKEKTGLKR